MCMAVTSRTKRTNSLLEWPLAFLVSGIVTGRGHSRGFFVLQGDSIMALASVKFSEDPIDPNNDLVFELLSVGENDIVAVHLYHESGDDGYIFALPSGELIKALVFLGYAP